MTRTIAIVDGNAMIHRAFHALPPSMTAPDGRPTNAVFGLVSMLIKLVDELRPDGVVVAWDKGKPAFRTEALAQYKAHRPPTAQELRDQFPMAKEVLDALAVPQVEVEGWEADDLLGTLASRGTAAGLHVLLVTSDRDALQLVNETVHVVSTKKGITDIKIYDPEGVKERFGIRPDQIIDYLGLKGDTSDNIPGVPGVGEKTAAKLLDEYGTLDAVYENASGIKGKLGENLREHEQSARISRTVATISLEVPVDLDMSAVEWGGYDPHRLAETFSKFRFTTLLDRVLALAGAGTGESDAPAVVTAHPESVEWDRIAGAAALDAVREWASGPSWIGVALDDGTADSLFAVRRDVAVASAAHSRVALIDGDHAESIWATLLGTGHVASGDTKALLHELCPPLSDGRCDLSFDSVSPERLFDCSLASYLLESHRSSFDVAALSADYLARPLMDSGTEHDRVAFEARAAAELAPVLEERLRADGSLSVLKDIEIPLVPVLARMERAGVGLDISVLTGLAEETRGRISTLRAEILREADADFNPDSPKQLAEVMFEKMGLPASKKTKTGYSTDASVLRDLAAAGHRIAQLVMEYRELTKLQSTYIEALPLLVADDGRIHTTFNQTVAATGRLSSSNPNLQNIPVRTEFGRRIRAAFVPGEPGWVMVGADYSQIELRVLAHLSGDTGLIEAFTSGEDFHAATAARVFGVPVDGVTTEYRSRAKAVNFGIVYGQSAHGLADSLKIGHAEAQAMIDRYYAAYPGVRAYLDETIASAHREGFAITMFGRKRRIPELASRNYNMRSFGERTAMNHPMQGTAADIMKLAMIEVDRRLRLSDLRARMLLQVHDELVFECPAHEVEELSDLVRAAMSDAAELSVPLDVDVSTGANWATAK